MNGGYSEAPKEIAERETQELVDMLSELIEKAEALKRRLGGISNRDYLPTSTTHGYRNSIRQPI